MSHTSAPGTTRVPDTALSAVPTDRRVLAPDLARGVMLLFIALAHAYIFAGLIGGEGAVRSLADQIVSAGTVMFVEFRAYPMFAALFGYGVAQIHRRRSAQGHEWPWVRSLLRRRSRWLIVFGVLHAALLFFGDILAVYGLVALVFMGALRFSDRTLVVLVVAWLPLAGLVGALLGFSTFTSGVGAFPPPGDGWVNELLFRAFVYPVNFVVMFVNSAVPFLVGILAARHRLLEEPHRHLNVLRTVAFAGIPLAALGGLASALAVTGVWTDPSTPQALLFSGLHQMTGYAGGLGYAALIALVAVRLADRQGPVTTALAALGQRSMTFYLAQSVVWLVLFASYTLHLDVSPTAGVGIAVAVWLTTVVLANLMRLRGMRGPAEVALRHLTYRPYRADTESISASSSRRRAAPR